MDLSLGVSSCEPSGVQICVTVNAGCFKIVEDLRIIFPGLYGPRYTILAMRKEIGKYIREYLGESVDPMRISVVGASPQPGHIPWFANAAYMRVFDDALVMESSNAKGNITLSDWFGYRFMKVGRSPWTLSVFVDKQH